MARYDDQVGGLHLGTGGLKLQTIDVEEATRGKLDYNPLEDMQAMLQNAQKDQAGGSGIEVAELDVEAGLADLGALAAGSEAKRLLQEANQLLLQKKFRESLPVCDKVLDLDENLHEARYLRGVAYHGLKEPMDGFRAIAPLQTVRLQGPLATRVKALRGKLRAGVVTGVMLEHILLLLKGSHEPVIRKLEEIIELDPDFGLYYFMLAGSLGQVDQYARAVETLERGMKVCSAGERTHFELMRANLARQLARQLLEPAATALKRGDVKKAKRIVNDLKGDPNCAKLPLVKKFDSFAGQMQGGFMSRLFGHKQPPNWPIPRGPLQEVEPLYFLLVGKELREARKHIKAERFGDAANGLQAARKYAPEFPFLNFLLALSINNYHNKRFAGGDRPDLKKVVRDFRRAATYAAIGARDPQIKLAKKLRQALEDTVKVLDRAAPMAADAGKLKPLVEQFNTTGEKLKNAMEQGSGDRQRTAVMQAVAEFVALRTRAKSVRSEVESSEARGKIDELLEALDGILGQLGL